ncbi:N-methyl-D-aspartate receptor NMDAR2C subunit [Caenimonas sedimenti]|uniref:N-methyl-D-aspartate receptor NMDAR2C subunit n=1 Tax=Caenimonas sedimenti TaxID=2596921 RepID=A0A562ZX93_9BURK|nr:N-methyl-D-aspartate receptor NMDAR2C subunit [Caenimonas sedimenti]TWO73229.1 N-methyl-D-aspartate receptor NMDAR2C subunit [Caenimonas sedimenti]
MIGPQEWRRLWESLGARTVPQGLLNQLMASYSEPHRRYHTLQHLRDCLLHFDAARSMAERPDEVELALWFHDAVYDPAGKDNEERSADWARASMLAAGCDAAAAERVHALVLATRHDDMAAPDDGDTKLLLDIDLASLGSAPARFDDDNRAIRAEYAHVPEPDYRDGRRRILEGFVARPRIYRTSAFHDALERRARENLGRALAALQEP